MTQDEAVKNLLSQGEFFSIVLDEAPDYPIVPNILSKEQEEEDESGELIKEGEVEYMVSDGLPGQRGSSIDVYTWDDAVKTAKQLQAEAVT